MRYPEDIVGAKRRSKRSPTRSRATLAIVAGLVLVIGLSGRAIAGFYTDFLWFDSLDVVDNWTSRLITQLLLSLLFTAAFFVLCFVNLTLADRAGSSVVPQGDDDILARYDELVGGRRRLVRGLVSGVLALIAGIGASGQWNSYLLFRNGGSFGSKDPVNSVDLGFYVFKLPFLSYVVDWAFAALVIVILVCAVAHYLNGGIRFQGAGPRVTPQVKAHLSVLMALIALVKAADYFLGRYELLMSDRGVVQGATYTDVNAQLPALWLLFLISVLCAGLFIVNIRRRGWSLPIVAIALWALVALMAGELYPWFIQSFQVKRKESAREAPFITRNIEATREGMGLGKVVTKPFEYDRAPDSSVLTADPEAIRNIRLLDPSVVGETFQNLEGQQGFYRFSDMDVDRYPIGPNNESTQVVISARDLNPSQLPQDTWEARHLIYTHGYGVALAPANQVTSKGRPDFLVSGIPNAIDPSIASEVSLDRPELYFGEGLDGVTEDGYAIVGTTRKEQSGGQETEYEGTGGVSSKGIIRRLAFFLRFGDLETLTSDFLTSKSRVLYVRDVKQRVAKIAPFLKLDSDPYPVISGGRIKYVIDAYTTSDTFPNAQLADTSASILPPESGLANVSLNYVRNSVKAVVDAYDGTVDLYLADELYGEQDPIIRGYAKAFPGLFQPTKDIPDDLRGHLRYPEDLFKLQTSTWGRYHLGDPGGFYDAGERWSVAQDPGRDVGGTAATTLDVPAARGRIAPYYLQMKLPGSESSEFLLFRPFVPFAANDGKKQLSSFMVAKSDPDGYGQLEVYEMTRTLPDGTSQRNREVDGPLIVSDNVLSDVIVSREVSLLNTQGSKVDFGNLLIIPLQNSLLYVRPYYVRANTTDSVPELRKVVVTIGDRIVVGDSLKEALDKLFPGTDVGAVPVVPEPGAPATPPAEPTDPTDPAAPPEQLIADALTLFAEADEALRSGGAESLSEYQAKITEAQALIEQANTSLGGTPVDASAASETTVPESPTTTGRA